MKTSTSLLLILLIFFSSQSYGSGGAPDSNEDAGSSDSRPSVPEPANAFSLPSERFDSRTGSMQHEVVDYTIPGPNGLDIVMARSYGKSSMQTFNIGAGWDLEIPRLNLGYINFIDSGCSQVSNGFAAQAGLAMDLYITLSLPGQESIVLSNKTKNFPAAVSSEFVSQQLWTAKCTGTNNKDFLVKSPTGRYYLFSTGDHSNYTSRHSAHGKDADRTEIVVYATSMYDSSGNWVNYSFKNIYDDGWYHDGGGDHYLPYFIRSQLSQITASDGRKIDFTFMSEDLPLSPDDIYFKRTNKATFITSFTVQGAKPKTFNFIQNAAGANGYVYMYTPDKLCQPVPDPTYPILTGVQRPDGKTTQYLYDNIFYNADPALYGKCNNSAYGYIKQIKEPNGLTIDYVYQYRSDLPFNSHPDRGAFLQPVDFTLLSKTLSGPNIATPVTVSYKYFVNAPLSTDPLHPGYMIGQGDQYSYTFEMYDKTLIAKKYKRAIDGDPMGWMFRLMVEQAVLPLPANTSEQSLQNYYNTESTVCKTASSQSLCKGEVLTLDYAMGEYWQWMITPSTYPNRPMVKHTTYRSTGTYIVENPVEYYNSYDQPTLTREYKQGGPIRETAHTYFTNLPNHILSIKQNETITGIGTVARTFSPIGQLLTQNSYGILSRQDYYPDGQLKTTYTSKDGIEIATATYSDYKRGIAQTITEPLGIVLKSVVDDFGNIVSSTDANGNTSFTEYDSINRPIYKIPAQGVATSISYPDDNTTIVTRDKVKSTTVNDALGRHYSSTSEDTAAGTKKVSTTQYDNSGRVSFQSDPGLGSASTYGTQYEYDILNRVVKTTKTANNAILSLAYLPNDVVESTKPRGYKIRMSYLNYSSPNDKQLIKLENELTLGALAANNTSQTITTNITRDIVGKPLTITQEGVTRSFQYDSSQRLLQQNEPERVSTVLSYYTSSHLLKTKTIGTNPAIAYVYDNAFRLTNVNYGTNSPDNITYTYDNNGNKLSATTGEGIVRTYTYDKNNNRLSESLSLDSKVFQLSYTYNSIDQLVSVLYPNNSVVHGSNYSVSNQINYVPNGFGQTTAVTDPANYIVSNAQYSVNGMYSSMSYGNGAVATMTLNNMFWPQEIIVRTSAQTPATTCTFNKMTVDNGASVTAYLSASVPVGTSCTSQVRTCTNGVLSGTYTSASCSNTITALNCAAGAFGTCSMPATNSSYIGIGTCPSGYTGSCESLCTNGTWTNVLNTCTPPATAASCTFSGNSVPSGSYVLAYQTASVAFGSSCTWEWRSCSNGVLSGSYTNSSCSMLAGVACTASAVGSCNMTAATSGSIATGTCSTGYTGTCTSSCSNGTWSPETNTCLSPTSPCDFNGYSIASGSSVINNACLDRVVPFGKTCNCQTRNCTAGVLSGSFQNFGCVVAPAIAVASSASLISTTGFTANWITSAGATWYYLEVSTSPTFDPTGFVAQLNTGNTSYSVTGLTAGTIYYYRVVAANTNYAYVTPKSAPSNIVAVKTTGVVGGNCNIDGSAVLSGTSITAFLSGTVYNPATCTSQTRTCANGVLSGTYAFSSCSVVTPSSCSAGVAGTCNIPATNHGSTANGTCPTGTIGTCSSTCTNGIWGGGTNNCTVTGVSCIADTIGFCSMSAASSGTTATGSCSANGYNGNCSYTCTNGSWVVSYNNCNPPASCLLIGVTGSATSVASGVSTTAYQKASVAYGSTCVSQTETCNNGTFSPNNYPYATCTVAAQGSSCAASSVGTCSMAATAAGASATGSCSSGYTGSCTSTCSNGSWLFATNTCVPGHSWISTSTAIGCNSGHGCASTVGALCSPVGATSCCSVGSAKGGGQTYSNITCQ